MSMLEIKQLIEQKFISEWAGTTVDKVRFENVEFSPPDNEYWVSLDIVFANSQNSAISSSLDVKRNGFIIIDCYGPPDDGSRGTVTLLDEATNIFENTQFSRIQCLASRPRHIGINNTQGSDALWYIYRTSIPFYRYE